MADTALTRQEPDRLLVDGRIWTGAGHVEALAVRGGRVLAAGSLEEVRAAAGPGAEEIGLGGRRVIPGLIDSHVHFVRAGAMWLDLVRWDGVGTLAEGLGRVAEAAGRMPAGSWIRVLGSWHPGQFAERRMPTRAELDEAAPEHPVYVQLLYEEAVLNSRALATLGPDDPPGGVLERDGDGNPTGVVRGPGAFGAVLGQVPVAARDRQRQSTRALMRDFHAGGVTGVIDPGGIGMTPEAYGPLFDLWREGELTLRTRLYLVPAERGREVEQVREWVRYVQPGFGDEWLRYVGMGEILTFGCHDLEGVGPFQVTDQARSDLREIVRTLAAADWNVHVHAVLDDTIGAVLDVWEQVRDETGLGSGRWSLAHAEPISSRNLARVRDLGAGIAVQDRMVFRAADSGAFWGGDVLAEAPPVRTILDMGIPLGAGTDGTVVSPLDPWLSIWWLVTGGSVDGAPPRDPGQRLDVEEALRAYTAGSAWFSLDEAERGSLRPGHMADLAVLSEDPFEVDPHDLRGISSVMTMVGGRIVWGTQDMPGPETASVP